MTETPRRTPLYEAHRELKARIVPFAGWEMPVSYAGILEESRAVRTGVGIFDISHMGRTRIHGPGATTLLQQLTTNDVSALSPGKAQYSLLTNPQGGIIDDIILYCRDADEFLVVINASNTAKDLEWIRAHADSDTSIEDNTEATAMIAVQGPTAPALVESLTNTDAPLVDLDRFAFATGQFNNVRATLCRTGYTGEDGFEIIVPAEHAAEVWNRLVSEGAVPCGLGARDALRLEAGYPLYGHEIDDTTTPVEAALMWVVRLDKGPFTGSDIIAATKARGAGRKLVGLTLRERIAPRQGYTLYRDGEAVGTVTSGTFSPTTGHSIGMAYVSDPHNKSGTEIEVEIRANRYPAVVVPKKDLLKV